MEQLNMIIMAKELGFTLKEIRELTELLYSNNLTQSQMGEKLLEKNKQLEIKISELSKMKTLIDNALKVCVNIRISWRFETFLNFV